MGLSWIVEDRVAGVNAPEWPALCDRLLERIEGETPEGFADALRACGGMDTLAGGVIEMAGENKIDLKEFALALRRAGALARQVAAIKKGA